MSIVSNAQAIQCELQLTNSIRLKETRDDILLWLNSNPSRHIIELLKKSGRWEEGMIPTNVVKRWCPAIETEGRYPRLTKESCDMTLACDLKGTDGRYLNVDRLIWNVVVAVEIKSLHHLISRINRLRKLCPGSPHVVVSRDFRFENVLKEQGIGFLEFKSDSQ